MIKISLAERIPLPACMALLVGGATAFFFAAMPMALGVLAHAMAAGGAAFFTGGLTWASISLADKVVPPAPAAEEGLPIQLRAEEYPDLPAWRPIFASEIGSPDAEETPPVFELTDIVAEDEPAPVEPLSIAALMARLEAGIERRASAVQIMQTPVAPIPPAGDFGTLRNVLDELQRMAVR